MCSNSWTITPLVIQVAELVPMLRFRVCFPAPGPMNPNVAKQPSPLSSMSIQSRSAILAGLNFTQELSSISFIDIAMYPLASSLNLQLKCMVLCKGKGQ